MSEKSGSDKSSVNDANVELQNLIEGTASQKDIENLRNRIAHGEIVIGGNVDHSVIIIGDSSNSINSVQLSPEAINRLIVEKNPYAPNQLPPLPANFVGRKEELAKILKSIHRDNEDNINIITGMAGVGKTVLAIMVSNSAQDYCTDGVLYVDFHGRSKDYLKPIDAMRYVLHHFGERVDILSNTDILHIYHASLAGKKVLMVFDDVENESQIDSILPPKTCKVIVTSRKRLKIQNSITWALDVLLEDDAIELLRHSFYRQGINVALDYEDAKALASALSYHPLVLQIAIGTIVNNGYSIKEFLKQLSLEILENAKDDPNKVFAYISRISGALEKDSQPTLNETKILFVGQGGVGKTSIVKQILSGIFDRQEGKTDGITINHFQIANHLKKDVLNAGIRLNIWDFGGQEIMHATHQFFLTKRSLYLLILDSRLTQEENRLEYWLKIIQSFSGDSPVLLVGNKTDQHPLDIDRTGIKKKYPNIVGIIETSAATGAGIEELKAVIAEQVSILPHISNRLPETWFAVKTKIEVLGRETNFITHDKYIELCTENAVSDDTSQRTLIGILHDLGVVLYFQEERRLAELGILNPQWVTNGVYKILNSHTLFQNKGVLTVTMLDEILNLPEYPANKRLFIVGMMRKFELCYDLPPDNTFLVPDLLPKDEPFTGEWQGALTFQYHYDVLPSSIITRFIVRMNGFIHKTVWRSGVVLKNDENTALVKADTEERKIYIWVNGEQNTRRDFLAAIRAEFAVIHKSIIKIEATQKIPVPGHPETEPIPFEMLSQAEREGRTTIPVMANGKLIDVNVRELLNGIAPETDRLRSGHVTQIHIDNDFTGNLTVGDDNNAKSEVSPVKQSALPLAPVKPTVAAADSRSLLLKILTAIFVSLPRVIGRAVLDIFGRGKDSADSSTILLGYVLIVLAALVLWGILDLNSLRDWFTGWWRFFFPMK